MTRKIRMTRKKNDHKDKKNLLEAEFGKDMELKDGVNNKNKKIEVKYYK